MPNVVDRDKTRRGTKIYKLYHAGTEWVYRRYFGKKEFLFNLGIDKREALKRADSIRDYLTFHTPEEAYRHFYPKEELMAPEIPTFQEVIWWFRKAAKVNGLAEITTENYVRSLTYVTMFYAPKGRTPKEKRLMRRRALNKPLTCLTKELWMAVVTDSIGARGSNVKVKNTLNGHLANLKAMFHPHHTNLFPYWDETWVEPIMKMEPFSRLNRKYRLPSEDLIVKTIIGIELLEPGPVRNYLTLALRAGLRKNEIIHARPGWVDLAEEVSRIYVKGDRDFTPKGMEGYTEIKTRFIAPIVDQSGEYLVGAGISESERVDEIPTTAVSILREWGWEEHANPVHELRKLYGSILASTRGLYTAQAFLRHSNSQVTSDNYADLVVSPRLLKVWDEAADKIP